MKILILGAGEVGTHLARLLSPRAEIVLIDRNAEALSAVEDSLDVLTVMGDITHRRVLQQADAKKASLVVAVTGSDDANLIGAALSSELGASRSVARVDDPSFYQTKSGVEAGVLGVHAVLCAARLVGDEIIRLINAEDAESVRGFARGTLHVAVVKVSEAHPVCGRPTKSLPLERGAETGFIQRDGKATAPGELARVEVGDRLFLAGEPAAMVSSCRNLVGAAPKRGMLIGGGDVGLQLARMLRKFEGRVQVVEKNHGRADYLAEHLSGVNIIAGDGSSIATLRDEHIESVDYVAALTRSDEVNLMVSLVSRDLGVKSTYTLVHRPGYEEVYRHLGVLGTTGPHDVLARAVERLLPLSTRLLAVELPGTGYDCVEFQVPRSVSEPLALSRLALPPFAYLLGRVDEAGTALKSDEALLFGQTLVIASPAHAHKELEATLSRLGKSR